ncbi:MAG TPA: hypothetical protein DHW45_08685 [Candidatus Latescibacteria bacterium]|nr:hypothetical protein [Candidatus Latescibacterota bacterium]
MIALPLSCTAGEGEMLSARFHADSVSGSNPPDFANDRFSPIRSHRPLISSTDPSIRFVSANALTNHSG